MSTIVITTNGTVEGTKLSVDGKDVTKKEKIVGISLYASAPYKSSYDNETYPGGVRVSYTSANEDGTVSRKSLYSDTDRSAAGIGNKITSTDQVVQFLGYEADVEKAKLVDNIIEHCEVNKLACPAKDILLSRSMDSIKDKIADLNIETTEE